MDRVGAKQIKELLRGRADGGAMGLEGWELSKGNGGVRECSSSLLDEQDAAASL